MLHQNLPVIVKQAVQKVQVASQNIWVRLSFLALFFFILSQKEFTLQFSIGSPEPNLNSILNAGSRGQSLTTIDKNIPKQKKQYIAKPQKTSMWWDDLKQQSSDIRQQLNLANAATAVGNALSPAQQQKALQYSNLGFALNPGYAQKHNVDPSIVALKNQICVNYINKHLATAQEEADLFNIPVSITLSQGLLESNAGESKLAKNDNNHFGIKCRSKCLGCRCANYTDDSKYDMFRIFETSWMSFREHSKLLMGKRYKHLLQLQRTDYKNWAYGLKAAGYATDKKYANKLIAIIDVFGLQEYDQ